MATAPAGTRAETTERISTAGAHEAHAGDDRDTGDPYVDPIAAALTATPEPTDVKLPTVEAPARAVAVARIAAVDPSPAAPSASTLEAQDDASVPPVGDLDVRDDDSHFFDGGFFDEGRLKRLESRNDPDLSLELDFPDPRGWKLTGAAARRRAELVKYVVGVVGVASALCVAALIRGAVPRSDGDLAAPASAHRPYVAQVDSELPAAVPVVATESVAQPFVRAGVDVPAAADERLVRADAGASLVAPSSTVR